ncbi:MAG TPA: polysaccharide deacetylase family protein [Anaeromyxobacter sp.]
MTADLPGPLVNPIVLMYHRVCADAEWRPSEFVVTASTFRRQLRWLAGHGYWTPRLSEVLGAGGRAPRRPGRPVILTFDDGYADNLAHAVPALREVSFTAALFPVLDLERRVNVWDDAPALRAPLLSVRELRAVEDAGLELGSHGLRHRWLTRCADAELREELVRSREVLASVATRPLPVLAYPYGDVDERVKRAVRAAGYEAALAVNSGPLELRGDRWEIRRQRVANRASDAYLGVLLSGTEKLWQWSKWRVRTALAS